MVLVGYLSGGSSLSDCCRSTWCGRLSHENDLFVRAVFTDLSVETHHLEIVNTSGGLCPLEVSFSIGEGTNFGGVNVLPFECVLVRARILDDVACNSFA
jgi:hypothetical protein